MTTTVPRRPAGEVGGSPRGAASPAAPSATSAAEAPAPRTAPPDPASGDAAAAASLGVTVSDATLRRFLHGLPGVDHVGLEARVARLASRSLVGTAEREALDLAVSLVDLTTLEGPDTADRVRGLCAAARRPDPGDPSCPPVAAVCVYGDLVEVAAAALAGSGVKVAAVAGAFPSGRAPLEVRLADVGAAVAAGADEVDVVIDRGAFLAGRYLDVHDEIAASRQACGRCRLKVILETGELGSDDDVRRAAWLAMLAGADLVKTSTGKVSPAATPTAALVLAQAVRDFRAETGRMVGVKVAGGIRTARDALRYLVLVHETCGNDWLTPDSFRLGASSLLDDLVARRRAVAGDGDGDGDTSARRPATP